MAVRNRLKDKQLIYFIFTFQVSNYQTGQKIQQLQIVGGHPIKIVPMRVTNIIVSMSHSYITWTIMATIS